MSVCRRCDYDPCMCGDNDYPDTSCKRCDCLPCMCGDKAKDTAPKNPHWGTSGTNGWDSPDHVDSTIGPSTDWEKKKWDGLTASDILTLIKLLYRLRRHFQKNGNCYNRVSKMLEFVEEFKMARQKGNV